MSADTVIRVPVARQRPTNDRAGPGGAADVGSVPADSVAALAARLRAECASAIDVDEVAAILETSGINDRVAANRYGAATVFALAADVLAQIPPSDRAAGPPAEVATAVVRGAKVVTETLIRTALYLTPLGVGLGAAHEMLRAGRLVTVGTLVVGWGSAQALAYLGYGRLGVRGAGSATRALAAGFAVVAAAWAGVLAAFGTTAPRGYVVALAQLSLFAVTAVALVTGRERVVLAWAVPCWLAGGAIALGFVRVGVPLLLATIGVLIAVAYAPAVRRAPRAGGGRWQSRWHGYGYALQYGCVGTGQALLLVIVALSGSDPTAVPPEAVPLLCAVPLIELTLIWHQGRVSVARAVLDDRRRYGRRLIRVSSNTLTVLALPVLLGAGLLVATLAGAALPGGARTAAAAVLCGLYALCLVLAAHRRTGTAALLVWVPMVLSLAAGHFAPVGAEAAAHFDAAVIAGTLLGACLPGLVVVAVVLRNPESYR